MHNLSCSRGPKARSRYAHGTKMRSSTAQKEKHDACTTPSLRQYLSGMHETVILGRIRMLRVQEWVVAAIELNRHRSRKPQLRSACNMAPGSDRLAPADGTMPRSRYHCTMGSHYNPSHVRNHRWVV